MCVVWALQDFVTRPASKSSKPSEAIARDSLALLKRRPEPEAAVVALQEVGLLRLHEPVPLLRLGHNAEGDFAPKLEQAAQVCVYVCVDRQGIASQAAAGCVCV